MQTGPVLFLHLFDRPHFPPQSGKLRKFLLNSLEPLLPVPVRHLSMLLIALVPPIPFVQLVNLGNLHPQTPNFFPQNLKMIHITSIS